MNEPAVECRKCRHYYITWDRKFPYGCKAMNFRSVRLPSLEVLNASAVACRFFEDKSGPGKGNDPQ
jgi:hypothetical protein